jgi:ArsR family transcriptional regulator, arsenate/arsenite/antimonite-responsive transcriptional repressor
MSTLWPLPAHVHQGLGLSYYVNTHRRDWWEMSTHLAFDALADDVRRSILLIIAEKGECSAGEIADSIERVGRTTVSSHLRVLRTSGVVTERREGRYRYYSLDREGPTRDALEFLQGLLRSSLRELKSNAEAQVPSGTERHREAG